MAAGFKTATVRSGDVPATQTNFPSYVDLDRLGITTLAEAESVRVYADSGKTTEWAREIVSVTEMHVKVPSLTSTVEIFVDWDGVRADYAVGATYGRNEVWSDYESVFHMQDASGSLTDATGLAGLSVTGSPTFSVAGQIDDGVDYNGTTADHKKTTGGANATVPVTVQAWFNADNISSVNAIVFMGTGDSEHGLIIVSSQLWALSEDGLNAQAQSGTLSSNTWYMGHGVFTSTTDRKVFVNGSLVGTNTTSKNITTGAGVSVATRFSTTSQHFDGTIDEVRVRKSALSANWMTTEYNNQNAEATFWGTWTDAGGGGSTPAQAARRGAVMMM
jgi:hypothetical protein